MPTAPHALAARTILAILATGTMFLAGCGGSTGSSTGASAPTKAEYTSSANAICRTTAAKTTPLVAQLVPTVGSIRSGDKSAVPKLSSLLAQLHSATSDGLAKLRGLAQPAGGHAAIERFLTPFASVTDTLANASAAAAAGQAQKAIGALEAVAPDARRMADAAAAYGLGACETVFGRLATAGFLQPIHATFVGDNHTPKVNKPWHYTVTVTGPNGEKLSGTETTNFTYQGIVVGTEKPVNVKFTNGVYHDTLLFPASAVGHPLAVQAVVHTSLGSATVSWPIEVKR